jgi:hypothetical protein
MTDVQQKIICKNSSSKKKNIIGFFEIVENQTLYFVKNCLLF